MSHKLPISLKIVAIIFLIHGILTAIEVVTALMQSHININFGVLGIFVGIGLFKRKDAWRICGLVLIWIGLIFVPIICLLMLTQSNQIDFNFFGNTIGAVHPTIIMLPVIAAYALLLWERWVLSRPDIKAIFQQPSSQ